MDHLLSVSSTAPAVNSSYPLLTAEAYDGGVIETYPERQGYGPRPPNEWIALLGNGSPEFLAFLQRWLLLGLFESAFGHKMPPRWFDGGTVCGQRILTTQRLPDIARWAVARFQKMDHGQALGQISRLRRAIILAMGSNLLFAVGRYGEEEAEIDITTSTTLVKFLLRSKAASPNITHPTVFVPMILALDFTESYFQELEEIFEKKPGKIRSAMYNRFTGGVKFLWDSLTGKGWCRTETQILFTTLNVSSLMFLDRIERFGPDVAGCDVAVKLPREYLMSFDPQDFSQLISRQQSDFAFTHPKSCTTGSGCSLRNITKGRYITRHIKLCPGCEELEADGDGMQQIFAADRIPVVPTVNGRQKGKKIQLTAVVPNSPYVAISHVWSDGLGNIKKNALPQCQLQRLSTLVGEVPVCGSPITHFWLDTICVPRGMAGQDSFKTLALQKMREIYRNAAAVIVLDSWLMSRHLKTGLDAETLLRIFVCHWTRRLWTFQEGFLAKRLYFVFSNGLYDLDEGVQRANALSSPVLRYSILPSLNSLYNSLRGFHLHGTKLSSAAKMAIISLTTRHRSTSVKSDEALCLATIFGLKTRKIAKIKHENEEKQHDERMRIFWSMMETVPLTLLFHEGERLKFPGARWAPRTMLRCNEAAWEAEIHYTTADMDVAKNIDVAYTSAKGLSFQWPGFIFRSKPESVCGVLYFIDDTNKLCLSLKPLKPQLESFKSLSSSNSTGASISVSTFAFISVGERLNRLQPSPGKSITDRYRRGIYVAVTSQIGGRIFGLSLGPVIGHDLIEQQDLDVTTERFAKEAIRVDWLSEKQNWCIG